jgi:hypothetical protein
MLQLRHRHSSTVHTPFSLSECFRPNPSRTATLIAHCLRFANACTTNVTSSSVDVLIPSGLVGRTRLFTVKCSPADAHAGAGSSILARHARCLPPHRRHSPERGALKTPEVTRYIIDHRLSTKNALLPVDTLHIQSTVLRNCRLPNGATTAHDRAQQTPRLFPSPRNPRRETAPDDLPSISMLRQLV